MVERIRHCVVQLVLILELKLRVDVIQRLVVEAMTEVGEVSRHYHHLPRQLPLERDVDAIVVGFLEILLEPEQSAVLTTPNVRPRLFPEDRNQRIRWREGIGKRLLRYALQQRRR